ncbi:MAG: site-2 protease family protein [Thiohalocapsa sp.]|nr:site-2 protease family protein [Thiohalocapsa sp.]MCF7989842.1 site-2 protease family protein [Thiohalocapsa sp.]
MAGQDRAISDSSSAAENGGPFARGVRLGRIAGVLVRLDWSLLIIFFLIATTLAAGLLPSWHPEWSTATLIATAAAAAVLFLASVLAHELAHAVMGRRLGVPIEQITLFVFGGMAHMSAEPPTWRSELAIALAGPLVSLAIGFSCLFLAGLVSGPMEVDPDNPIEVVRQLGPVATVLFWLGPVNIILGIFNMVPGFPLDGGRVLRAILWGLTSDFARATRIAAAAGQFFAWLLIASGFLMILGVQVPVFGSGALAGLWIALIGWFLNNAATMGWRRVQVQQTLGDVPVSDVMHRDFGTVEASESVQALIDDHFMGSSQRAFPVIDAGRLAGLVCLADVRQVHRNRRTQTRVGEIMTPVDELRLLAPDDAASDALSGLAERGVNQFPVVESGRLLGLITREDILRWIALRRDEGGEP